MSVPEELTEFAGLVDPGRQYGLLPPRKLDNWLDPTWLQNVARLRTDREREVDEASQASVDARQVAHQHPYDCAKCAQAEYACDIARDLDQKSIDAELHARALAADVDRQISQIDHMTEVVHGFIDAMPTWNYRPTNFLGRRMGVSAQATTDTSAAQQSPAYLHGVALARQAYLGRNFR